MKEVEDEWKCEMIKRLEYEFVERLLFPWMDEESEFYEGFGIGIEIENGAKFSEERIQNVLSLYSSLPDPTPFKLTTNNKTK